MPSSETDSDILYVVNNDVLRWFQLARALSRDDHIFAYSDRCRCACLFRQDLFEKGSTELHCAAMMGDELRVLLLSAVHKVGAAPHKSGHCA